MTRSLIASLFGRSEGAQSLIGPALALAVALAAWPALAADDYPPGLFENSPVAPSGPPGATAPAGPPDADSAASLPPDSPGPLDAYCASVFSQTFHSLEEVRRAHARCDPDRGAGPLLTPDDQPSQ